MIVEDFLVKEDDIFKELLYYRFMQSNLKKLNYELFINLKGVYSLTKINSGYINKISLILNDDGNAQSYKNEGSFDSKFIILNFIDEKSSNLIYLIQDDYDLFAFAWYLKNAEYTMYKVDNDNVSEFIEMFKHSLGL